MNRVQPIYDITLNMKDLMDQNNISKYRESTIEKLNSLMDQREMLIEQLKPPFTKEEEQVGKNLLSINRDVQNKMKKMFSELKIEMKQVKKQKSSNQSYMNPYRNVQVMDGMYMDQKK